MIYILLPVHNRREITKKFVECLKNQTCQDFHLVLIDDGCTDGTAEMVKNYVHELTVIRGNGNWWWAGALQQGYKWLKSQQLNNGDIVLMINDDSTFEKNFLLTGQTILNQYYNTLLLAQAYSLRDNQLIDAGVHVDWKRFIFSQAKTPDEINCLSTRGLFLKVKDFLKLGGFYPIILPHYLSDYEFTIRSYRRGYKLITNKNFWLFSDESSTGFHSQPHNISFIDFLKIYLSKKSSNNPIYYSSFILLVCPWPYKMLNLLKVWYGGVKTIVIKLLKNEKTISF